MRKHRSDSEWIELIRQQKISGKSIAAFSREQGIHPNHFYKKNKQIDSIEKPENPFVELKRESLPRDKENKTEINIGPIKILPAATIECDELLRILTCALEACSANI